MNDPTRSPAPAHSDQPAWSEALELAFEGLAVLDGGRVVRVNAPFAALLGLEGTPLEGQDLGERFVPRDALAALSGLAADGVATAEVRRADGTPIRVELRRKPLGDGRDLVAMRELDDARRLTLAVEALAAEVAPFTGQAYFESLCSYLVKVCALDMAVLWELRNPQDQEFHPLAGRAFGGHLDVVSAARPGSPCDDVVARGACVVYAEGVRAAFPDSAPLAAWEVEAYIGVPLRDADGRIQGVLALMHTRPLQGIAHLELLLAIIAPRAAAELSHQRASAALKAGEARYRDLVEQAADLVLRFDRHGRFLYANPAAERISGKSLDQLVGRTYREAAFPEDLCALADAKLAHVFAEGAPLMVTIALPTPAGARHLEFQLTPERGAAGAIETVHAIGRDITELRGMAVALRERECQLSTLIANLPGMAYRCSNDARWTMAFVSEGCLELTGYAPDDFIDNRRVSFDQLYHPEDHARIWNEVQVALAAHRPYELTYRIRDRSGRLKWIWEKGRGIFDDDGALRFLEGLLMDVSATKELADQLARREAQLQEAQQLARLGSWEWDMPTGALTWSDEHYRLLGLAPGAVAPSIALVVAFVHPEDAEALRCHLGDLDALRAKPRFVHDCRLVRADGEVRHVHARGEAAFDAEGRLSKVTGTLQDVTEWRRVETELLAANETLTRLGAMKDEFLSIISHELRTPLAAIQSAAAVLLKGRAGPLSELQQRFVTMVRDHGAALQRLVDDMLDYQQLTLADGPIRHAPSDVCTLVSAVAAEEAAAFEGRGLTLTLALPDEAVSCRMDRRQIAQVLRSLLSNAAKFTPAGGRVTVAVAPRGADVHLIVRDTGQGIPPDGLERIFEKFMQLDGSMTRPIGGAGLGLALCKRIVEVGHGGRIWAESTLGVGTALHVALPAAGPDAT